MSWARGFFGTCFEAAPRDEPKQISIAQVNLS